MQRVGKGSDYLSFPIRVTFTTALSHYQRGEYSKTTIRIIPYFPRKVFPTLQAFRSQLFIS